MIPKELVEPILQLLRHSWEPAHFKYDGLTVAERTCIDREEHAALVSLMEDYGLILGPRPTGSDSWDESLRFSMEQWKVLWSLLYNVTGNNAFLDRETGQVELDPRLKGDGEKEFVLDPLSLEEVVELKRMECVISAALHGPEEEGELSKALVGRPVSSPALGGPRLSVIDHAGRAGSYRADVMPMASALDAALALPKVGWNLRRLGEAPRPLARGRVVHPYPLNKEYEVEADERELAELIAEIESGGCPSTRLDDEDPDYDEEDGWTEVIRV